MTVSTDAPDLGGPTTSPFGPQFSFMRWRWSGFAFTAALFVLTTVSLAVQGLNLGLDFTGGVLVEARAESPFDAGALRTSLTSAGIEDASVQLADGDRAALIRVGLKDGGDDLQAVRAKVEAAVGGAGNIERTDVVGPQVSAELLRGGLIAAAAAVLMIAVYVWFRFEWKFGLGALITTFHDVYVLLGLYSLTHMTFDLTSIAALLTIAGYSINDTVVVYDRIRETLKKRTRARFPDIIDEAINATLSRTVVTGFTTLTASFAILFFAGATLFSFAAAIIAGVLIGTYSSVFVAAPLLIHLPGRTPGLKESS